ncbi:uncharacterized protein LOC143908669 [Temnothorax americanus]|uniref:uncharacterized protein LOC143908669 n=1 Tax=Temnothorax americanus TaxID=1964332 RepID=UPI004068BC16
MSFLAKEVQAEQRIEMVVSGIGITSEAKVKDRNKRTKQEASETPTAAGLLTVNETIDSKCIFCDKRHNCVNCEKAKKLSLAESVASNTSSSGSKAKTDTQQKDVVENLSNLSSGPEVFMQTLMVKVYNDNQEQLIRAVVDSGSHHSYISADVTAKMQFKETGNRTMIHSLFGGVSTQPLDHKRYLVCLRSLDGGYACNFNAFEQNKICVNIPRVTGGSWIKELSRKSINLTDANHDEVPISLLIGADVAGKLLTGRIVQLDNGVTVVDTKFGWTIMVKNPSHVCQHNDSVAIAFSMFVDEAKIEDLWNLDVLGIQDPIQKSTKEQHQENVLKGFRHSTIIIEQRRYEVCLPWKENHPTLPMNRATAERRLESTSKKLKQDGLYQAYDDVFQDWLNDGIIEELSSNKAKDYGHYLPHRHVVKENSTTRIRPVFDASSRERGGPSLNQCLETGPNFIELIPELLLRFRLQKFEVIADIRKAFLQISVSKQNRDVMKFLWKRRPEDTEFVVYRHCRVVFGVSSSPFLLGATIDLHLENIARDLPKEEINLIRDLAKSFYVDNSITSHPTVDEVKSFKKKATLYAT